MCRTVQPTLHNHLTSHRNGTERRPFASTWNRTFEDNYEGRSSSKYFDNQITLSACFSLCTPPVRRLIIISSHLQADVSCSGMRCSANLSFERTSYSKLVGGLRRLLRMMHRIVGYITAGSVARSTQLQLPSSSLLLSSGS